MIIQNGDVTVNGEVCTMRGKKCVKATLQSLTEKKLPLSELGMIFLKVLALKFENYRNLDDAIITPCDGVNVIYGDNAQGKPIFLRLLDVLRRSFVSGFKGQRTYRFWQAFCKTRSPIFGQDREQTASIKFKGNKKQVEINSVAKNSAAALIENIVRSFFRPNISI